MKNKTGLVFEKGKISVVVHKPEVENKKPKKGIKVDTKKPI